ncbi:hypothetical protein L1O03_05965 [Corynebacterium uropygiale]|uniref:Uncharacterized protein n=1 Tax=Corynebacterium uropygiale TaxID=1775911 RepID=A0A9X1TXZ9_9CORY|nr:hypothetical protein [Corynebacterium uropygiale]MCF4006725.1 hypothetical protein [Corynebacterium uropygiale]
MDTASGVTAAVTLWFVSTEHPADILSADPRADRGFGRKYLAQLNPSWPVTSIGEFPINRSVPASPGEFYIGGFGRVSVVQTLVENADTLSELDPHLLRSLPAERIYAFAQGTLGRWEEFGGFARWDHGELRRSLCATRDELFEDAGLPFPFESPFWAGERNEQIGGISLPFIPLDLVAEAEKQWLGVPISPEGPDIHIAAFAVDGRPAPRVDGSHNRVLPKPGHDTPSGSLSPAVYDDYEDQRPQGGTADELARITERSLVLARRAATGAARGLGIAFRTAREKLRHIDRS